MDGQDNSTNQYDQNSQYGQENQNDQQQYGQNNQYGQYGQDNQYYQNNQYGQSSQSGQSGQYNYGNMNANGNWQDSNQKKEGIGFGVASLVLGIISLLLFCTCMNWITGILAIVFGILQLVQYRQKGLAIGGLITAGISLVLSVGMIMLFWLGLASEGYSSFYEYYDSYENGDYDDSYYDDGYYDDSYYDDYDDYDYYDYDSYDDYDYYENDDYSEGGGNEFLSSSRIYF